MQRSTWIPLVVALTGCTALAPADDVLIDAASGTSALVDAAANDAGMPDASTARDATSDGPETADGALSDAATSRACPPFEQRTRRVLSELEIPSDTRWSCKEDYEIDGYVIVNGGTLTIEPSVRVFARPGAVLIVGRHARIDAQGEADRPIVFSPVSHPAQPGAFDGLILLGLADTALPNNATLGLPSGDARAYFGGDDDTHDCGSLRYVRIEYAGTRADAEDLPAAALTLAGCGRKTRVEYVQVHAPTDGIGLIGGTVPLKHVLVTAPHADGIEWTAGYRGLMQFAIVQSFYGSAASLKGSQSLTFPGALPRSAPVIFNATLVGAPSQGLARGASDPTGFEQGLLLQAGSGATIQNSLFYGQWGGWVDVVGSETAAGFSRTMGPTRIASTIFADGFARTRPGLPSGGTEAGDANDDDGNFSESAELHDGALQNRFPLMLLKLRAPFARPPLRLDVSTDDYVQGGTLVDSAPSGWQDVWEPAFYAGALPIIPNVDDRTSDWTAVWTSFPEE